MYDALSCVASYKSINTHIDIHKSDRNQRRILKEQIIKYIINVSIIYTRVSSLSHSAKLQPFVSCLTLQLHWHFKWTNCQSSVFKRISIHILLTSDVMETCVNFSPMKKKKKEREKILNQFSKKKKKVMQILHNLQQEQLVLKWLTFKINQS